eukprot:COSAG06_NODE_4143_length_4529_cov_7.605192_1_plen_72_part_00
MPVVRRSVHRATTPYANPARTVTLAATVQNVAFSFSRLVTAARHRFAVDAVLLRYLSAADASTAFARTAIQ